MEDRSEWYADCCVAMVKSTSKLFVSDWRLCVTVLAVPQLMAESTFALGKRPAGSAPLDVVGAKVFLITQTAKLCSLEPLSSLCFCSGPARIPEGSTAPSTRRRHSSDIVHPEFPQSFADWSPAAHSSICAP